MPNEFDALLDTLRTADEASTTLAKSMQEEAEFEHNEDGTLKCDAAGKPVKKATAPAADATVALKALTATLSDGTSVEGFDATDLLKALNSDMQTMRSALPRVIGLIVTQNNMLKSLQAELAGFRKQGVGRASALTVTEKTIAGQSDAAPAPKGLNPKQYMAKAMDCFKAGKLDGTEIARIEAYIVNGQQVPDTLDEVVMGPAS